VRLTQIKLAGFKSFVDPTSINIPGQLVGVVGPNGCGKSNIMDAVRWVLGESRAAALRGDSMQDVIFNGSSLRKPVARASVELMFDNSLGKAAGQWSQYAEISVRRTLQRDGESSYGINGTHVRRRDVHDIFLGTGLGPRAYAIIEQGMISRIIEAKPEELRVFLEEAAGVSKYKERRRETENRLADTRENLARVSDIRQELGAQIEKLARQAEIAQKFNELSAERTHKQSLLWLLRRNDAQAEVARHARDIERGTIDLEAETARLRDAEREAEQARSDHYAAGDALNAAQGQLYGANAEVARIETEIRFVAETRQRLDAQLAQARAQREAGERQEAESREAIGDWQGRLARARDVLAQAQARLAREQAAMPEAERVFRDAQARLDAERERLTETEKTRHLEQAHVAHADKTIQALEARAARLVTECDELVAPDAALMARLAQEAESSRADLARQEGLLAQLEAARAGLDAEHQAAIEQAQTLERELSALDGRQDTLQKIQGQVEDDGDTHGWLERHRLVSRARLWQKIRVEPGWETAVESALRERLHALDAGAVDALERLVADPPPSQMSAFVAGTPSGLGRAHGLQPLVGKVKALEPQVEGVIDEWLAPYYAFDGTPRAGDRESLPAGAVLVNRDGHQFSRYGVRFHAADPADTGILARQREIEALAAEIAAGQGRSRGARERVGALEAALAEHDEGLAKLRAAGAALGQRHHERQLEHVKLTQSLERHAERSRQIEGELAEIGAQRAGEDTARAATAARLRQLEQEIAAAGERLRGIRDEHVAAESRLSGQRVALQQAEREVQEAIFSERECISKLNEIDRSIEVIHEQIAAADAAAGSVQAELSGLKDEALREQLQQALAVRVGKEQALAAARARQEEIAGRLRQWEEARAGCEQKLQPLRDRIAELRLKEQAAHIALDQFTQQLAEAGADVEALAAALKEGQKAAPLQGEITRLANAIGELGAINMAALEELATGQERKQFLDAQAADLTTALETLENAIRKIDRETRDLLQATFDTVNEHFGQMFPVLFGGGEAKLVMTGEEILDCGVQVIARPPGKKNTSIHLLSGGEKALTAIALVFSFFQLNPAPFCLLDEVDAPLDDSNTERFCDLVKKMSRQTQFLFISHNKITMEMASQLVGVTMQEQGVSRVVAVDIGEALKLREEREAA
jgi:chromosome segregation protein